MNNFNKDKVSVIIPTYKRPGKLKRAIDSVLNQTYDKCEVIVVDDNTEGDEFREETELFMSQFDGLENVVYLKHCKNKNGSAARNTGIKYSESEYISFLDDDDYFFSSKIEKQVALLKEMPSVYGGVCCDHISKYKDYVYKVNELKINEEGNYVGDLLRGECVLAAGSTLLLRQCVFSKIGLFDESFSRHQDWEFLVRFFREFKLKILQENLVAICVDGFRNYPKADMFFDIKSKFLKEFSTDIAGLKLYLMNEILFYQWSEVFIYYLNEYNFTGAMKIYRKYMKPSNGKIGSLFYLKCIYIVLEQKMLFLSRVKYKLSALRFLFYKENF